MHASLVQMILGAAVANINIQINTYMPRRVGGCAVGRCRWRGMFIFESACAGPGLSLHRMVREVSLATLWGTWPQQHPDEREAAAQEQPYEQSGD